jgi:hypothetical protein
MKNLKLTLAIGLAAITTVAYSQKIDWSAEQKNTSKMRIGEIIGSDATGCYVIRTKPQDLHEFVSFDGTFAYLATLEKYDFTGNRIFSKALTAGEGKDSYNYDRIFCMKNGLMVVMYAPDAKTAVAMKVNPDGSVDNNKVQIGMVENKNKNPMLSNQRYKFALSADKSTLLAYYHNVYSKDNKLSIAALGDTPNLLWSKDITTSFADGKYDVINATVVGNSAYLLVRTESKGKKNYTLVVYNHATDAVKQVAVASGDNNVLSLSIGTDNSGNAVLAGLYGTSVTKDDAAGTFVFTADNAGKVVVNNFVPFTADFLLKFISQKKVDKGEGIAQLTMNKIIVRDDKSIILAAEQKNWMEYFITSEYMNTPGNHAGTGQVTENNYEYRDAVVAKLNADGSVAWIKDFAKKEEMSSRRDIVPFLCSYGISITGNTVNLIYNDHKNNDGLTQEEIDKSRDNLKLAVVDGYPSDIAVIMESVDIASGDSKRITLYNGGKQKAQYMMYVNFSLQTGPNKFFIYRGDDKTDQFGQLVIQ